MWYLLLIFFILHLLYSSWSFSTSYWFLFVLLLFFPTQKIEKVSKTKIGTHLPTSYRSSRINNKLWCKTSSWSFYSSSCCATFDPFCPSFDPCLSSFCSCQDENSKSSPGRKIVHTYQQLRDSDASISGAHRITRTSHTPISNFKSNPKEVNGKLWWRN